MPEKVTIIAGGDVAINRAEPESIFAQVGSYLREADIAFCHNETVYSDSRVPSHARLALVHPPRNATALKSAGVDVMSCAGNHAMDGGPDALLNSLETLRGLGIACVGAGRNIGEARQPAILERNGTKVAFLAYNSILPIGCAADVNSPGCVPLRVYTFYEQTLYEQPGITGRALTFPYPDDLEAMKQDIEGIRPKVDIVVVSYHWGVHHIYAEIAMYEKQVARVAIEAGADLILGHHAHLPKGIDVYKGKVIFHSLAHLAIDVRFPPREQWSPGIKAVSDTHKGLYPNEDPEWAAYPFLPDSRKSLLAKIVVSEKKIQRVSFLPMLINKQAQPAVQHRGEPGFDDILEYMTAITQGQGLKARFSVEGDEVVISS